MATGRPAGYLGALDPCVSYASTMITTAIVVLGVGSLLGGALGWKLGRSYERLRGGSKGTDKTRASKDKATSR